MSQAIQDIVAERRRQIEAEGWTLTHDDEHGTGEMAQAAAAYAYAASGISRSHGRLWPWAASWWKPAPPRRMLVKAAALIVAEIERLDRLCPAPMPSQHDLDTADRLARRMRGSFVPADSTPSPREGEGEAVVHKPWHETDAHRDLSRIIPDMEGKIAEAKVRYDHCLPKYLFAPLESSITELRSLRHELHSPAPTDERVSKLVEALERIKSLSPKIGPNGFGGSYSRESVIAHEALAAFQGDA